MPEEIRKIDRVSLSRRAIPAMPRMITCIFSGDPFRVIDTAVKGAATRDLIAREGLSLLLFGFDLRKQ